MKLRFSPAADGDLAALQDYLSHVYDPSRVRKTFDGILRQCKRLETWPEMGRPRDELRPGWRSLNISRTVMVVFYRLDHDRGLVEVLRVLDGRRDLPAIVGE